jgi:site-specific DNA-methyltransferase (adenine-specific)
MSLTPKQKQILDFIKKYLKKNGYSPTQGEIAKYFRSAKSTINEHIKKLQENKYLEKTNYKARSINISDANELINIPLLGFISAGQQIEMFEQQNENIVVPKSKIKTNINYFALKVMGDSMIEKNINNGDIVLIKEQNIANNGDDIVALIDDSDTTLKTFYKEKNCIRLQPANKNMQSIIIKKDKNFTIQGIVTDIIKTIPVSKKNIEPDYKHNKTPANHRDYIHKTNFNFTETNISTTILDKLKAGKILDDYFWDKDFLLINGDCIKVMRALINFGIKVDHIITDIPYGTVNGLSIDGWKAKGNIPNWDSPLDIDDMLQNCFNISRTNTNLLLFAQEPMTNDLINGANYYQKYTLSNKMIWVKNNHANGFSAKTTPVNYYEEILLFRKSLDETNSIKIRRYFKNILDYIGKTKKEIMEETNQGLDHCFRYANRTFYIPTLKNYIVLIEKYNINKMPDFISYEQLKNAWLKENETIFNLPKDQNIVKNVIEIKKDTNNIHPTQKPQQLLKQLILLFSNKNDYILDFTAGSGSTGIACIKLGRKFIGIELDKHFYKEAIKWYKTM